MRTRSTAARKSREDDGKRAAGRGPETLARLLYDPATELPTLPLFFGRIQKDLRLHSALGLMTISIIQKDRIDQIFGWDAFDALIRDLAEFLAEIKPLVLREEDIISELMISGNAFVILLAPPRDRDAISYANLDKIRQRVQGRLRKFVAGRVPAQLLERLDFSIGCAMLEARESRRLERLIYQALDSAFADSLRQQKRTARQEARWLRDLLRSRRVYPVFQPVVDLEGRAILGYEALSRSDTARFQSPDHLFKVAYENDAVWELERVCREKVLTVAASLGPDHLLFLNTEPEAIYDPELRSENTIALLERSGLTPGRIVLELTEHSAVKDFALFRQTLRVLQAVGFRLAIDDVGSAYSGLRSIAELRPDFMKIDMSLTRAIHANDIKRELMGTILKFSRNTGIGLIAEGIEEREDLATIRSIGVRYAQGFLLARPARGMASVPFQQLLD